MHVARLRRECKHQLIAIDLSGVGFNPLWVILIQPRILIDPLWFSRKYSADPPLTSPENEPWLIIGANQLIVSDERRF